MAAFAKTSRRSLRSESAGRESTGQSFSELEADGTIETIGAAERRSRRLVSALLQEGHALYSARLRSGANDLPGCGAIDLALNEKGRASVATCLQWMGSPMRDQFGVVVAKLTRNSDGLVTEQAYVDAKGGAAVRHDGVHTVVIARDEMGRELKRTSRDVKGALRRSSDTGCVDMEYTLGANGDVLEETCRDADGKPTVGSSGVAV